ncbi:MAG: ATP-binding protein [Alphaproteobacteria bacterium]
MKLREDELRQAQKMEALGQLTGGVAHDFNNLLAIMLGNVGLLEEELGPDSALLELTAPTLRAIDQATEVTSRMLSFARRQPLIIKSIDLNELFSNLRPLLRQALVEEIGIRISTPAGLWPCLADLSQLEQAILNLAINARDAMPLGGQLHIKTSNITLPDGEGTDHPELPPGQYVIITIADTGEGIAAADLPKIFEPFFTTKAVGQGSGLGLSMVHGFAKQSNGDVLVQSIVGAGTKFSMYLPRAHESDEKAAVAAHPAAPLPGTDETILVVGDEEDVRSMVARSLRKLGYEVLTVAAGPAGLAELERHGAVHLLLTDVMLPGGLNGQQLADQAAALYPDLKILFMSGYARDAIVDQGRLRADVRLLAKPFSQSELGRRVRDILDEA